MTAAQHEHADCAHDAVVGTFKNPYSTLDRANPANRRAVGRGLGSSDIDVEGRVSEARVRDLGFEFSVELRVGLLFRFVVQNVGFRV